MSLTIEKTCPRCYKQMETIVDRKDFTTKTFCPYCGYEEQDIKYVTYANDGPNIAFGESNPYRNIIIEAETLQIHQDSIGLTIDIPISSLLNIDTIEINGFKFKKETL